MNLITQLEIELAYFETIESSASSDQPNKFEVSKSKIYNFKPYVGIVFLEQVAEDSIWQIIEMSDKIH